MAASRIAEGLGLRAGCLLYVHALPPGCEDLLAAVSDVVTEENGRIFLEAGAAAPNSGDERLARMEKADAVLAFDTGMRGATAAAAAPDPVAQRVTEIEEARRLPFMLCAVPTPAKALILDLRFEDFEKTLLDAIGLSPAEIRAESEPVLRRAMAGDVLTVRTPNGCELTLSTEGRRWLLDDGVIDDADRRAGAIVSNLPAASIYTTVIEDSANGTLWLPTVRDAIAVTLHFVNGRIQEIESDEGGEELEEFLDRHTGEPRRISHVGVGLNRHLREPVGWTLIDEHVLGTGFVCLGENRYMGGHNASSLNFDVTLRDAELLVNGDALVRL